MSRVSISASGLWVRGQVVTPASEQRNQRVRGLGGLFK
jgi:hypothetical protein